jgi:hypothetical protein
MKISANISTNAKSKLLLPISSPKDLPTIVLHYPAIVKMSMHKH